MPSTVGQYQQSPFTTPIDGTTNSAADVTTNDNATRAKFNGHDADPLVHIQSSTLAARPAFGVTNRLWYCTDVDLGFRDTGTAWAPWGVSAHTHGAADITSGTLDDARIPSTVPRKATANVFTDDLTVGAAGGKHLIAKVYADGTVIGNGDGIELQETSGGIRNTKLRVMGASGSRGFVVTHENAGSAGLFTEYLALDIEDSGLGAALRIAPTVGTTGTLYIGANPVLGPRKTGWSLPTGTLSRAAFDQSTVTLPQLAQRVAALITDFYGHGAIGA